MDTKERMTLTCEVDSYRSGWTVVEFLAHRFKYHTAERWRERVSDNFVRVNDADVHPDHVVSKGDRVAYTIWHRDPPVDPRFDVLYEDGDILAVAKSGNLPVHACGVYLRSTLIALVKNRYGDHLNLAHRLDRETSGVVVLTKNPAAAREMGRMFAGGRVAKSYVAVVYGRVGPERIEIDAPIARVRDELVAVGRRQPLDSDLAADRPVMLPRRRVDYDDGRPAVTHIEVERHTGERTLLRARPLSGRTNQIRVHLHHIGHPIVGDKVYGPPGADTHVERHALHCAELVFDHPMTGCALRLRADTPEDIKKLVENG